MAEALTGRQGKTTGINVCIFDADGNPVVFVSGAIPVSIVSGYASPLEKYILSDSDEQGTTRYYGYLDISGNWYIRKDDSQAGTQRFVKGTTGYVAAWTARTDQTYEYFDSIF